MTADMIDLLEVAPGSTDTFLATVVAKNDEADGVRSFTLEITDKNEFPSWEAGAHVDVELPNGLIRQYSLCGERSRSTWRIAVLREPSGRGGSDCMHDQVQVGDALTVRGPRNNFQLEAADEYLFIAGGIGITPIVPMIRAVAEHRKPWRLLYGGRSAESMAFLDELRHINGGEITVWPEDQYGLLDLDEFLGNPRSGTVVYSCGPQPLLNAINERAAAWPDGSFHQERFAPKPIDPSANGAFEVELARSGRRVTIPPFETILDVLEDEGVEVTNSCRAGICGTCITGVLNGTPEHNDDVLSEEEQESNSMMCVCVSRSKTDVITLDL